MKILIAEDDPMIQWVHQSMMSQWGYDYDLADSGYAALELARSNAGCYDLALMDVEMPLMDGIEATRQIRREVPYFPIAAFTTDPGYKWKCLAAGMDAFLQKPCRPDQMFGIIKELSVKPLQMELDSENISITKVMPMNPDELRELRELKKQGLTKLRLLGIGHAFIVHKNIQNKISHDLIGEGKELSEFIDRTPSEPGLCHLYKANLHVTKDIFLPEELEEEIKKENEVALRFSAAADERSSDK